MASGGFRIQTQKCRASTHELTAIISGEVRLNLSVIIFHFISIYLFFARLYKNGERALNSMALLCACENPMMKRR